MPLYHWQEACSTDSESIYTDLGKPEWSFWRSSKSPPRYNPLVQIQVLLETVESLGVFWKEKYKKIT